MAGFIIYIIKSSFCLLIFYLGYKTLLSSETFFRFNRRVLLGGVIASLLLPLVEIKTERATIIQQPFVELEKMIVWEDPVEVSETVIVGDYSEKKTPPYYFGMVLYCFYILGGVLVLLMLIHSLVGLYLKINCGRKIQSNNYTLVLLEETVAPFNWWTYIVLSETDYNLHKEEILTHELAHYRKHHSFDLFLFECIIILHWFNPAVWLLKRELQDVHEYQADMEVINNGIDATKYQLLLVKKAVGSSSYTFANSFNQSKLKKRITMMCKQKSNKWAQLKLMLLIPVATSAMYAFARPEVNNRLQQIVPNEVTTITQDGKPFANDYFDSHLKAYFEKMTGEKDVQRYEMFDRLAEQMQVIPIFVEQQNRILYNHSSEISVSSLASSVKTSLDNVQANNPVIFKLVYNNISADALQGIYHELGMVFESKKDTRGGLTMLVYTTSLDQTSFEQKAIVTYTEHGKAKKSARIYRYDSQRMIQNKLNVFPKTSSDGIAIQLTADKEFPMGTVTDIKDVVRKKYKLNYNSYKNGVLIMSYHP